MVQINIKELEKDIEKIFQQVEAGEDVIVSKENNPIAKIVKFKPESKERKFGLAPDIEISEDFDEPLEDFREYMP